MALARALANNADLIIADEPTGNVDPRMSLEIVDLLMRLNSEGTTVIMVTHEHNLVRMYDKRVILLENGTVAADGKMKNSGSPRDKDKRLPRPPGGRLCDKVPRRRGRGGGQAREAFRKGRGDSRRDRRRRCLQAALESFGKEKAEYGTNMTPHILRRADYSIYLEDGEGDESDEK